jgi:hypothetical protein
VRPPPSHLLAPWCRCYWDRSATPLPMRRCRGCKNPRCDDPVVSHWGCKRARPAQHSANALQWLVSSVPPARGDAQPGGFVHRVGCGGCSDDEDCDRTRATPLCPYGADRTWEIDAARAALLPAETMPPASAAARAPAAASASGPTETAAEIQRQTEDYERRVDRERREELNAEWYIHVYLPHEARKRARWIAEQAEKKRQHKESVARMVQVFEDAESQMVLGKAALQKDDDAAAQAHFASALQLLEAQGHPPFSMRRRFRLELAYCKSWARWAAEKASDECKQRVRFIAAVEEAYERLKTADAVPVVLETWHAKAIHRELELTKQRIRDYERCRAGYAVPWWYRGPCPAWRDVEAFWRGQPPDPCPEWRATVGSLQESLLQQLAFDEVTRPRRLADEQRRQEQLAKRLAKRQRRQWKGGQVAVLPACDGRFHCGACWAARERDLRRPPYVRSERSQLSDHIRRACEYTDGVAKSFRGHVMAPDGCRRHYALCVCGLVRCAAVAEAWVRHLGAADWQSALREVAV